MHGNNTRVSVYCKKDTPDYINDVKEAAMKFYEANKNKTEVYSRNKREVNRKKAEDESYNGKVM